MLEGARERRLTHTLTQFIAYISDKEINIILHRTLLPLVTAHRFLFCLSAVARHNRSLGPSVVDPTWTEQDQYHKSLIRSFVSIGLFICYSTTGSSPSLTLTLKPLNHNLNLNPTPYLLLSALHNHPFIAGGYTYLQSSH